MKPTLPKYLLCENKFAELMQTMEHNGIYLNKDRCNSLIKDIQKQIDEIDKELIPVMPKITKVEKPFNNIYKKNGELNSHASNWINSGNPWEIDSTLPSRLLRWKIEQPNPGSDKQLRAYLLSIGWKPSERLEAWNYAKKKNKYGKDVIQKDANGKWIRSSPKMPKEEWELAILSKRSPVFRLIAKRLLLKHRLGTVTGYVKHCLANGRIPMRVNSCGTNTMRVTHKITCNVPKIEKFMGKELRSVFCAAPGKVLVGCDMSGQEACILAHILADKGFIKTIQDNKYKYHLYFHDICKEYVSTPDKQKGVNFAFLYGCLDPKLGSLCDLRKDKDKKKLGAELRTLIENKVPNLKAITTRLRSQFKKYGAIQGLDGRWVKCRKESALINTYCQSGGAICSKIWTCRAVQQLDNAKLEYKLIIFMHDELVVECNPEDASVIMQLLKDAITWTSEYLQMRIPLVGTAKSGHSWVEIH